MRAPDGEAPQPDGNHAVGRFVVLEQAGQRLELARRALHVCPAAGAQAAVDALAAGPGVGGDAAGGAGRARSGRRRRRGGGGVG